MANKFFILAGTPQSFLATFEWGWLAIFVACVMIGLVLGGIILLTVWLTGGFSGRN